jgi:hypothetical protein
MKLLSVLGAVGILFLGLSLVFPILMVGAFLFILAFVYFAYARYQFSPRGGNIQAQVQELVLSRLDWDGGGQALDIGCGNAPLTIKVALKFPYAHVTRASIIGAECGSTQKVCAKETQRAKG